MSKSAPQCPFDRIGGGLKLFRQCPYGNNTFHKGASVKVIPSGPNTLYIRSQTKLWILVVAIYSKTQIIKILLTGPGANSFPPYFRLVGNPDFYDHQLVCRNSHRFGIEKFIRKSSSIANLECSFFFRYSFDIGGPQSGRNYGLGSQRTCSHFGSWRVFEQFSTKITVFWRVATKESLI